MVKTLPFAGKFLGGILLGTCGYILGYLLDWMEIFPELAWAKIFLFIGVLVGLFRSELEELF